MAKSRTQKAGTLDELSEALNGAKGIVFANFAGLNVKATTALRRSCRESNVKYVVAKKTLLKIAFDKLNITMNPRGLTGGVAIVFGYEDEISAAKLLREFAKENEALKFVGGLIPDATGWKELDAASVTALSKMPGKQELIGQVVGTIAAPLRGFVSVLSGNARSLVQVLKAIEQSKA